MENTVERAPDWTGLPVIATVARLLCRELTLQNEYLRLENRILKEKVPGRIGFTDAERRSLADAALAMGRLLTKEVVGIVKPETILAWQRRLEQKKWDYSERRRRGPGRPRTPGDIEALVCRLARENLWGYERLRGELLKLRVVLAKGCIADILRRNGLPPAPQRAGLTWQQFLSRHAEVMLCADLFTKEVWTLAGLRTAYVLFVLHLGTRRIVLAEATFSPHGQWMGQMARNLLMDCEDVEIAPRFVLHDRDKLLVWDFDAVLTGAEVRVVKTPFRAPDANAHAERWVRSVTEECLDHLILFGMGSLRRSLRVYRDFFNGHRPHQGIGNQIPERRTTPEMPRHCAGETPDEDSAVECEQFLGGLLNSYYRKAAWSPPAASVRGETPRSTSPPAPSLAPSRPVSVALASAGKARRPLFMIHHGVAGPAAARLRRADEFLDSAASNAGSHLHESAASDGRDRATGGRKTLAGETPTGHPGRAQRTVRAVSRPLDSRMRYRVLNGLLLLGRDREAGKLLRVYREDAAADWLYGWALWSFRQEGDSRRSRRRLSEALDQNPYVPEYLLGERPLPRRLPDAVGIGGEDEAARYAAEAITAWRQTPAALEWLGQADEEL